MRYIELLSGSGLSRIIETGDYIAGSPVIVRAMLVDSAVRTFLKQVDLVLVGSDAITSEGNVINKIGTSLIALAAQEARTPFYVATELFKFDPQTIHDDFEVIEERSPDARAVLRVILY